MESVVSCVGTNVQVFRLFFMLATGTRFVAWHSPAASPVKGSSDSDWIRRFLFSKRPIENCRRCCCCSLLLNFFLLLSSDIDRVRRCQKKKKEKRKSLWTMSAFTSPRVERTRDFLVKCVTPAGYTGDVFIATLFDNVFTKRKKKNLRIKRSEARDTASFVRSSRAL